MNRIMQRLIRDRRGAVALIAGLSLVPMVLMVGLAIDYSFFAEARSQVQLAADAAAAHAVRAAAETFALETSEGASQSVAEAAAVTAGNLAGSNWFQAQLGQLPTASVPLSAQTCSTPTANVLCVDTTANSNPVGFSADVAYSGSYPPFFDGLFHTSSTWGIDGTSGATAGYGYAEIVVMLDTSPNMELGADQTDIVNMQDLSTCPTSSAVTGNGLGGGTNKSYITTNTWLANNTGAYIYNATGYTSASPNAPVSLNFDEGAIVNYTPDANPENPGKCANGTFGPNAPCAFACHTDNNHVGAASQDLYGIARQNGVKLRLDVVLSATEQVIQTMIQNEQTANQFSIGVFQFNTNVSPIVQGTVGTDPLPYEATTELNNALQDVYKVDYNNTPSETSIPIAVTGPQDYTNFQYSMSNLISGQNFKSAVAGSLTADAATSQSANATPAQNPAKNIFIVTDGYDDYAGGATGRVQGPFTGVNAEQNKNDPLYPGICRQLKNLGYTVYVLYIPYWSLANNYYQADPYPDITPTPYYTDDGGTGTPGTYSPKQFAEPPTGAGPAAYGNLAPNVAALQACSSNSQLDYKEADNSAEIAADMQQLLKQALQSSIRVTQ